MLIKKHESDIDRDFYTEYYFSNLGILPLDIQNKFIYLLKEEKLSMGTGSFMNMTIRMGLP